MLVNNKISLLSSLIFLGLCSTTSLSAANQYLFPSDIIDQAEQEQYDTERANRYVRERQWRYPQKSVPEQYPQQFRQRSSQYMPVARQAPYSNQYAPKNYAQAYQNRKSSWNTRSNHYKYDNFKLNDTPDRDRYPANTSYYPDMRTNYSHQARQNVCHDLTENTMPNLPEAYYNRASPPVYPGDLQKLHNSSGRRPIRNDYPPAAYKGKAYKQRPAEGHYFNRADNESSKVQYIPVPVYRVPAYRVPTTLPGIATPRNMLPGYSHLSPDYTPFAEHLSARRADNMLMPQFSPLSAFALSPKTMLPGLSKTGFFPSN